MGIRIGGHIEKVNGKEVSYSEFVQKYMEKNQPVVLTGVMDDWKACKDWVLDNGKPNLQFFSTHFGKSRVQVLFIVQYLITCGSSFLVTLISLWFIASAGKEFSGMMGLFISFDFP